MHQVHRARLLGQGRFIRMRHRGVPPLWCDSGAASRGEITRRTPPRPRILSDRPKRVQKVSSQSQQVSPTGGLCAGVPAVRDRRRVQRGRGEGRACRTRRSGSGHEQGVAGRGGRDGRPRQSTPVGDLRTSRQRRPRSAHSGRGGQARLPAAGAACRRRLRGRRRRGARRSRGVRSRPPRRGCGTRVPNDARLRRIGGGRPHPGRRVLSAERTEALMTSEQGLAALMDRAVQEGVGGGVARLRGALRVGGRPGGADRHRQRPGLRRGRAPSARGFRSRIQGILGSALAGPPAPAGSPASTTTPGTSQPIPSACPSRTRGLPPGVGLRVRRPGSTRSHLRRAVGLSSTYHARVISGVRYDEDQWPNPTSATVWPPAGTRCGGSSSRWPATGRRWSGARPSSGEMGPERSGDWPVARHRPARSTGQPTRPSRLRQPTPKAVAFAGPRPDPTNGLHARPLARRVGPARVAPVAPPAQQGRRLQQATLVHEPDYATFNIVDDLADILTTLTDATP